MRTKLTTFLYLLMRDHLPTGVVEGLIQKSDPGEDCEGVDYCCPHMEGKAKEMVERLTRLPEIATVGGVVVQPGGQISPCPVCKEVPRPTVSPGDDCPFVTCCGSNRYTAGEWNAYTKAYAKTWSFKA